MARVSNALGLLPLLLGACVGPGVPRPADTQASLAVEPAAGSDATVTTPFAGSAGWPPADSCLELVRKLAEMPPEAAQGLDATRSPLAMATMTAGRQSVRADLPIPQVAPAILDQSPCAIIVGSAVPAEPTAGRVLGRRLVHSAYPTGTKRRRNPTHQQLEKDLTAARRDESGSDVLKTGDPVLDLIGIVAGGVIGGIGAVSARREIRSIESALERTPAFIEDPILTPYRYELVKIEAERSTVLPVALHDGLSGLAWRTAITLTEQRRFAIADGRHAGDTQPPHGDGFALTTSTELAQWRAGVPPVSASMILTHLATAAQASEPEPANLEATIADLRTAAARSQQTVLAAPDAPESSRPRTTTPRRATPVPEQPPSPLAASPEAVQPAAGPPPLLEERRPAAERTRTTAERRSVDLLEVGDGAALGFYVTEEHIVVPAEALGRSSLIAVRYPDGMRAHGLVELVDHGLGLALVYLPRAGEPLPRRKAGGATPSSSGRPGTPWITDGSIGGVFVADPLTASPRLIDAPTLDRFVDRLATL